VGCPAFCAPAGKGPDQSEQESGSDPEGARTLMRKVVSRGDSKGGGVCHNKGSPACESWIKQKAKKVEVIVLDPILLAVIFLASIILPAIILTSI
jgi:hypothetical protein